MKLENVIDFEAVTTETNNIINNLSVETKNFFTRVYHYRNDTSGKLATSLNFLLDYSQESLTGFQKDLETINKQRDVIIATFNKLLEAHYNSNLKDIENVLQHNLNIKTSTIKKGVVTYSKEMKPIVTKLTTERIQQNTKLRKHISDCFLKQQLDPTAMQASYSTIDLNGKYLTLREMVEELKMVCGAGLHINIFDFGKAIIAYLQNDKKANEKYNLAIAYAAQHQLEIPTENNLTQASYIKKVNELAMDKFREEFIATHRGQFIEFSGSDNCENCRGWEVGSHRCDCGNRRLSITVNGDFVNGFYAYPEAY